MQKISIEEQHTRLLEIAKLFDGICTKHNIPYYMLGGTMLGAIRHKGFIPWDDDMDFGVPRPYYKNLVALLEKELPTRYRCCSYENDDNVFSPFFKIEDRETVIYDNRIPLPLEMQMGINIDVFPLDYCNYNSPQAKRVTKLCNVYSAVFVDSYDGSRWKNYIKKCLRFMMPYNKKSFLRKMDTMLESIGSDGRLLANVYGRWREKEWIPIEWYGENVRYRFESIFLCGLKEYDRYLKKLYKDYMKLPPEECRIPHADNIYLRS